MIKQQNHFEFTGAIFREGKWFVSLCLDLDVASQGRTVREATKILAEAVARTLRPVLKTTFLTSVPFPGKKIHVFGPRIALSERFRSK